MNDAQLTLRPTVFEAFAATGASCATGTATGSTPGGGPAAPRSPSGSSAPTASRVPSGAWADYQLAGLDGVYSHAWKNASRSWPLSASASAMNSAVVTLP